MISGKKYVRGTMVCTIFYGVGLTKDSSKAQKADKKGKKLPLACARAYIEWILARAFAAKAVLYQMRVCERPTEMRKGDQDQPTDQFDDLIDELGSLWSK